jgi:hypothetical protein
MITASRYTSMNDLKSPAKLLQAASVRAQATAREPANARRSWTGTAVARSDSSAATASTARVVNSTSQASS